MRFLAGRDAGFSATPLAIRGLLAVTLAWLLGAVPGALAARPDAGSGMPCGPAAARTLAVDRTARVYASGANAFGCARGAQRSYRLGTTADSNRQGRVGPIALAGDVAAYGVTNHGVDTVAARVRVRRLTDGAVLRDAAATTRPVGVEYFEDVDSVVVRDDGAVAWISTAGSVISPGVREVEVNRVDQRGRLLLDSGRQIRVGSLRRHGARVTWRHGGGTRSASLS